jgi:hypothetical protein
VEQNRILHQPIETLDFSKEFKAVTEILGMHTLNQLLDLHTRELMKLPGFTIGLLHEYVSFMESKGLGQYIDSIKKGQ